ncbi:MAG: prepilin-type N-terminal cleavage/methylation domain-containing protein [Armatimonadota bacterium]
MRRAFTLIELLVVIAIIAILAAILFPVFSQAKEAAKKTKALAQMKQLGTSLFIYAADSDDFLVPASLRDGTAANPIIWTQGLFPYVKNTEIFVAPDAQGSTFAIDWNGRRNQSIGYSDATGVDPLSTAVPGAAAPGTEGFTSAANFSAAEESARTGLIVTTPNSAITSDKERGYVFNPYNGAKPTTTDPAADYTNGLPLIADRNLVKEAGIVPQPVAGCTSVPTQPGYFNCTTLAAGALKPVYARYSRTGRNDGSTPVVFADSHAKSFTAASLNSFGKVIWRFR